MNNAAGGSGVVVIALVNAMPVNSNGSLSLTIYRGDIGLQYTGTSMPNGYRTSAHNSCFDSSPPSGWTSYRLMARAGPGETVTVFLSNIVATGGRR